MKLPNSDQAIVDMQKLIGYCLNPEHSDGQHKAYVFRSALEIGLEDAQELSDALRQAVSNYDGVPGKSNQHGQKYVIDYPLARYEKQAVIRSVWIVRYNESIPRLITCYVL